jgi:hypothetical protein
MNAQWFFTYDIVDDKKYIFINDRNHFRNDKGYIINNDVFRYVLDSLDAVLIDLKHSLLLKGWNIKDVVVLIPNLDIDNWYWEVEVLPTSYVLHDYFIPKGGHIKHGPENYVVF